MMQVQRCFMHCSSCDQESITPKLVAKQVWIMTQSTQKIFAADSQVLLHLLPLHASA